MNLDLLDDVKEIIKKNTEKLFETGEAFNLISLLGMENNERYTHSAIIGDLLNPRGSHGFKDAFLIIFLNRLKIQDFDTKNVLVLTEEHKGSQLGIVTYLDIVLKDKINNTHILIENKIWAKDQYLQLERYYESYKNKKHILLYLTPFGNSYCNDNFLNYRCISYQNESRSWISDCIEIAQKVNSFVANSLKIYKNIINKITNQSIYIEMANSIQEEILESTENFTAAFEIYKNFNYATDKIKNVFFSKLHAKIEREGILSTSKYDVTYFVDEDNVDSLYIGFKIKDKNSIAVLNDDHLTKVFYEIQKKYIGNAMGGPHEDWNKWYFVSSNSILHKGIFSELSIEDKILLYKNVDKEVAIVYDEFSAILMELKTLLD